MGTSAGAALPLLRRTLGRTLPLLALGLVAVLGPLGCVGSIDPAAPVLLMPEAGFSADDLDEMQTAAEDWNIHFGTQLAVDRTGHGRAAQEVPVYFSSFACAYVTGLTTLVDGVEVALCSRRYYDLAAVMRHELGHVLNILTHAQDERAVMAHGYCFAPEDIQLFEQANGGLAGRPGCQQARRPWGSTPLVTAGLLSDGVSTLMLGQRNQELEVLTLDARDARAVGAPLRLAGKVAGTAFPLAVTQDLLLLRVATAEGPQSYRWYARASGALLGQTDDRIGAIVVREGAIYGLVDHQGGSTLSRLDRRGWQRLPGAATLPVMSALVASDEALFALQTLSGVLRVTRFDRSGRVEAQRDYPLPESWLPLPGSVVAGPDALYVAPFWAPLVGRAQTLDLVRIDVRVSLGTAHRVSLRLGARTPFQPRLIWAAGRLWLASDRDPALLPLDPQTLQAGSWQILGQLCVGGGRVEAVATSHGLTALWIEAGIAWTRCLP